MGGSFRPRFFLDPNGADALVQWDPSKDLKLPVQIVPGCLEFAGRFYGSFSRDSLRGSPGLDPYRLSFRDLLSLNLRDSHGGSCDVSVPDP